MLDDAAQIAMNLISAIESRNLNIIRDLYADDITIWHSSANKIQSKEENLVMFSKALQVMTEMRYKDIRQYPIDQGVVQQHKVTAVFSDGRPTPDLHVCMILHVKDRKISKIDEYIDGLAFSEIAERIAACP